MLEARDRLIVALDVASATQARQIVQAIGEAATTYKVGKQLFTAEGPQVVRDLVASGRKVFLDLKFHDIPSTVAAAVKAAAELGASMLTVHASGGRKMLKAAVEAAAQHPIVTHGSRVREDGVQASAGPMILAVSVLTSLSNSDLEELGISSNVVSQVLRLGALARSAGCGGLVASAQEAQELRRELGGGFAIVTPGIRPAGFASADQVRVVTPQDAIAAGATHLVVGRPILDAPRPIQAVEAIVRQIEEAQSVACR
jgi:orotidine-5'-phosphate decarboxylase